MVPTNFKRDLRTGFSGHRPVGTFKKDSRGHVLWAPSKNTPVGTSCGHLPKTLPWARPVGTFQKHSRGHPCGHPHKHSRGHPFCTRPTVLAPGFSGVPGHIFFGPGVPGWSLGVPGGSLEPGGRQEGPKNLCAYDEGNSKSRTSRKGANLKGKGGREKSNARWMRPQIERKLSLVRYWILPRQAKSITYRP